VLRPWIGDVITEEMAGALGTLCAAAFVVGLVAVTLIERWLAPSPQGGNDADQA
jgi:hypothetical protein